MSPSRQTKRPPKLEINELMKKLTELPMRYTVHGTRFGATQGTEDFAGECQPNVAREDRTTVP